MDNKKLASLAVETLKKEYPNASCSLEYNDPFQLLVATRLAAQCTDARVNLVTPKLFETFKTAEDFSNANIIEVEKYIKSCGLYKTKARDIIAMSKKLVYEFNSVVPNTMEELLSLDGIGRKTANLILGDIFNKPAIVVDTHCIRLTNRLGFHDIKDAYKIEKILKEVIDPNESNDFCHRLVIHGRAVCKASKPKCIGCVMNDFCASSDLPVNI